MYNLHMYDQVTIAEIITLTWYDVLSMSDLSVVYF
jgi:hypothetical protein